MLTQRKLLKSSGWVKPMITQLMLVTTQPGSHIVRVEYLSNRTLWLSEKSSQGFFKIPSPTILLAVQADITGFPVGKHYKVAMSAHCHKLVPILIWPLILLVCNTRRKKSIGTELKSLDPRLSGLNSKSLGLSLCWLNSSHLVWGYVGWTQVTGSEARLAELKSLDLRLCWLNSSHWLCGYGARTLSYLMRSYHLDRRCHRSGPSVCLLLESDPTVLTQDHGSRTSDFGPTYWWLT